MAFRNHPRRRASAALLALALIAGCGGGGGGGTLADTAAGGGNPVGGSNPGSNQPEAQDPGAGNPGTGTPSEKALAASQPGELLAYFKERLARRAAKGIVGSDASPAATSAASAVQAQVFGGTTVQEAGVDEDDLLKTDGTMLYGLVRTWSSSSLVPPSELLAARREEDGKTTLMSRLKLVGDSYYSGMYLAPDSKRIALLGQRDWVGIALPGGGGNPAASTSLTMLPYGPAKIGLEVVDSTNPAAMTVTHKIEIDGRIVGSRMVGSLLYLVSTWSPMVPADRLPVDSKEREAATAQLKANDLLPTIRVNAGAAQPLLQETECYLQTGNAAMDLEITTVTAIDLASPALARNSTCFAGGSEALYMTPQSLYIATTRYTYRPDGGRGIVYSPEVQTDIHKFAMAASNIVYRGSGSVAGHLGWEQDKKSYRLSEHNSDLRVLAFTGPSGWIDPASATQPGAPSPATLSILRERTGEKTLQTISTLPNAQRPAPLGKEGEQVYAVRYDGARAYVVTFRRTDPLYVLDLSKPDDPKAVGELQTTGYSDYLLPMGNNLLLGVGKDADARGIPGGVKVSLFDVADPANTREIATRTYGKRGSASALDASRHGINLFFGAGDVTRVALPVRVNDAQTQPGDWYEPSAQGLMRFEVDRVARTLVEKPPVWTIMFANDTRQHAYGKFDVGQERAVQIGGHVYYLTGGGLVDWAW